LSILFEVTGAVSLSFFAILPLTPSFKRGCNCFDAETKMENDVPLRSAWTFIRLVSKTWMSHITRMNECHHTYEWVTLHLWMSHITHMSESRHTYERVMTHRRKTEHLLRIDLAFLRVMSHSRRECIMSHIWMSHVTHVYESCHRYGFS